MRIHTRLKAIMCAVAVTASVLLAPLNTFAAIGDVSGALSSSLAPKNVMVNVKNADARDVLSALAMNMGYNIVYTGPATTISIDLDNLTPAAAFDYILKILDLTYLQEGNVYIVGDRNTLQNNFSGSLALTRFNLRYITPALMSDMISRLRLSVTVITLNTNSNALWVQGFPADIAKVRELVNVMDIVDNSETPTEIGEGPDGKSLTPVKLNHITAYEFRLLLQALDIDYSVSLLDDGTRIYLYATPEELETVLNIKNAVDQKNIYFDDNSGASGFAVLKAKNKVTKDTAISAIGSMCQELQIVSVDNRSMTFVVMGDRFEIEKAKDLLRKLDINAQDLDTAVHIYQLKHITAAEAERRLQGVSFGDNVVWYVTTHADFSGTIFVYCSEDYYDSQVASLLSAIDKYSENLARVGTDGKTQIKALPIYAIRNDDKPTQKKYADGMQKYLEAMLDGIITSAVWGANDSITTPGSIKRLEADNMTVLYLDNTFRIEVFDLIEAMISRLSEVAVDEKSDASQLTLAVWWSETNQAGIMPTQVSDLTPAQFEAYTRWIVSQIGTGNSNMSINSLSADTSSSSYELLDPPLADEPPQPEDSAPTGGEAFETARIALDWLFYEGGIASEMDSGTTADAVFRAAEDAVYGIPDVVLRYNPNKPSNLAKPTETEKGSLTVSIILEVGGYQKIYDVELVLPAVTGGEE